MVPEKGDCPKLSKWAQSRHMTLKANKLPWLLTEQDVTRKKDQRDVTTEDSDWL